MRPNSAEPLLGPVLAPVSTLNTRWRSFTKMRGPMEQVQAQDGYMINVRGDHSRRIWKISALRQIRKSGRNVMIIYI